MIRIVNGCKLVRQEFFQELIQFLDQEEEVTLRQIKAKFPQYRVDRLLEQYIAAGYIVRENRRYRNGFSLLEDTNDLDFDREIFVDTESAVYIELQHCRRMQETANGTNQLRIQEDVDFLREELTLAGYFYKVRRQESLSPEQEALYVVLGDVNPEYALKYMTSFLLKFTRKDRVLQRRPDVFVEAMKMLGFIEETEPRTYVLSMEMAKEESIFYKKKES